VNRGAGSQGSAEGPDYRASPRRARDDHRCQAGAARQGSHYREGDMTRLNAPLLLDRYRPVSLLARGGMSSVFRGRDEMLGRDVAIKLFGAGSAEDIERYRDELRVLASLSHHGVVSIVDAGIDLSSPGDPRPFLVMELVRGRTLAARIRERRLSDREIGELGFEVAEALDYVHSQGVIHRDISPANIMLVDYGTTLSRPRARLTDFGIALDRSTKRSTSTADSGTVAYVSPEQVRRAEITTASDIYSLGLVLLQCFTGSLAFEGTPESSMLARLDNEPAGLETVPEPWRQLIRQMTAGKRRLRPSAAEVAEQLRYALRSAT
jgi:serine/threonine protein kinase